MFLVHPILEVSKWNVTPCWIGISYSNVTDSMHMWLHHAREFFMRKLPAFNFSFSVEMKNVTIVCGESRKQKHPHGIIRCPENLPLSHKNVPLVQKIILCLDTAQLSRNFMGQRNNYLGHPILTRPLVNVLMLYRVLYAVQCTACR